MLSSQSSTLITVPFITDIHPATYSYLLMVSHHYIIPTSHTSHQSHIPLVTHPTSHTSHQSHIPLVTHPISHTSHQSHIPPVTHPISHTSHQSHIPSVTHPISHTSHQPHLHQSHTHSSVLKRAYRTITAFL